jgi:phage shock protein A
MVCQSGLEIGMGVLERTKHVVRADLNDLLRKAKNPEVVLDAYLDDLETVLEEARSIQNAEEAERDMYAARLRDMQATQETWERKAGACLENGDEDLARSALEKKLELKDTVDDLENEIQQRRESLKILEESVETLKARIAEVSRKRRGLRFRRQLLEARSELQETMSKLGHDQDEPMLTGAQDDLQTLESRLEAEESMHKQSLDDKILRLEVQERKRKREAVVERELQRLRKRLAPQKARHKAGSRTSGDSDES